MQWRNYSTLLKNTFLHGEKRGKNDKVVGGGKMRWNLKIEAGLF